MLGEEAKGRRPLPPNPHPQSLSLYSSKKSIIYISSARLSAPNQPFPSDRTWISLPLAERHPQDHGPSSSRQYFPGKSPQPGPPEVFPGRPGAQCRPLMALKLPRRLKIFFGFYLIYGKVFSSNKMNKKKPSSAGLKRLFIRIWEKKVLWTSRTLTWWQGDKK